MEAGGAPRGLLASPEEAGAPPRLAISVASMAAISFCPPLFASCSGVKVEAFTMVQSAPLRNKMATMSCTPCSAATCNGVLPLLFLVFMLRPRRRRGSSAAAKPTVHASCKSEFPFSFTRWKSAPAFKSFSSMSPDLRRTA